MIPRVIHFVTGGGSGATKVALDLACGHLATGRAQPLLVLRRKRVPLPDAMQERIAAAGLPSAWVDEGPKWTTRRQLAAICREIRADVMVAHGFSEHLWGRQAAIEAKVPVVIHVEHNLERYPFWRRWSARRLAPSTHATVCVSDGVARRVTELGLASARLRVIHNGIDVARFGDAAPAYATRPPDIAMLARFARQKDHATIIRAAKLLADSGWTGRVLLAGGGKASHRRDAEKLVRSLGLDRQVEFLGLVSDVPALLRRCRVSVLSTHYEGLPLSLVESLAAGCAVVGSATSGVEDIIQPGVNGWTFPVGDAPALAARLGEVLAGGPAIEAVVARGQADAPSRFAIARMVADYENLFAELLPSAKPVS